jgi:hypothetical protein
MPKIVRVIRVRGTEVYGVRFDCGCKVRGRVGVNGVIQTPPGQKCATIRENEAAWWAAHCAKDYATQTALMQARRLHVAHGGTDWSKAELINSA